MELAPDRKVLWTRTCNTSSDALVVAVDVFLERLPRLGQGNTESLGDEPGEMGDNLQNIGLGNHEVLDVIAGFGHTCVLLDDDSTRCPTVPKPEPHRLRRYKLKVERS